jgi:hypothetical protein
MSLQRIIGENTVKLDGAFLGHTVSKAGWSLSNHQQRAAVSLVVFVLANFMSLEVLPPTCVHMWPVEERSAGVTDMRNDVTSRRVGTNAMHPGIRHSQHLLVDGETHTKAAIMVYQRGTGQASLCPLSVHASHNLSRCRRRERAAPPHLTYVQKKATAAMAISPHRCGPL